MLLATLALILLLILFVGMPALLGSPLVIIILGIIALVAHIVLVLKIIKDDYRSKGVKTVGVILNIVSAIICFIAWLGAYIMANVPDYAHEFSCGAIESFLGIIMSMGPCIIADCIAAFNDDEPGIAIGLAIPLFIIGGVSAYSTLIEALALIN